MIREHFFNKSAFVLLYTEDFVTSYREGEGNEGLVSFFNKKLEELESQESGWRLKSIDHLDIKLVWYNPMKGGCASRLPSALEKRRCVMRIDNEDNACLKWAITSIVYPQEEKKNRVSKKLVENSKKLNWGDIEFPSGIKDLKLFERLNPEYLLYVYGKHEEEYFIMYKSKNLLTQNKKILHLFILV